MAELNFDPTSIPADDFQSFEPLEPGEYQLQVIDSELKQTKSGQGTILKLTLEVLGPTHAGRRLFDNLNVQNPNETAERISKRSLADLCLQLGFSSIVRDSQDLHYKPFNAKVTIQQDKTGQFGPQNRVRYPSQTAQQAAAPFGGARPAAAAPKPAAPSPARPWAAPKPRI